MAGLAGLAELSGLPDREPRSGENAANPIVQTHVTRNSLSICPDFRRQLWLAGEIRRVELQSAHQLADAERLTDLAINPTRSGHSGKIMDWHQALALAASLAALLDEMTLAEIDQSKIKNLVPDNFAAHWQKSLQFFQILTNDWPDFLRNHGYTTRYLRQSDIMRLAIAACQHLAESHPEQPVSNQSYPDTTDNSIKAAIIATLVSRMRPLQITAVLSSDMSPLMLRWCAALAKLANGQVIIPGL